MCEEGDGMPRMTKAQIEDDYKRRILDIEELHRQEVARLEERLRTAFAENRDLRQQIEGFRGQISDLERRVLAVNDAKADLQSHLERQNENIARTEGANETLRRVLDDVLEKVLQSAMRTEDF